MRQKAYAAIILLLVLSVAMVGCNSSGGNNHGELDGSINLKTEGDARKLVIWVSAGQDDLAKEMVTFYEDEADAFGKEQNAETEMVRVPIGQLEAKLKEAKEMNRSPDVIVTPLEFLHNSVKQGHIADLSSYAEASQVDQDQFIRPFLKTGVVDGLWAAVPMFPDMLTVYYNKEWFDQAKLPYPEGDWSWDDFQKTAVKLMEARDSETQPGGTGGIIPLNLQVLEALVMSKGGSLASPDGRTFSGYLDSDLAVEAVEWLQSFYEAMKIDPTVQSLLNVSYWGTQFYNGQLGMFVAGSNALYYYQVSLKDKLGVAQLPYFTNEANPVFASGLAMAADAASPDLAWKFIKKVGIDGDVDRLSKFPWMLANSRPLAEALHQLDDPIKKVLYDQLENTKPTGYHFDSAMDTPQVNSQIALTFQFPNENLKASLKELAKVVDQAFSESETE